MRRLPLLAALAVLAVQLVMPAALAGDKHPTTTTTAADEASTNGALVTLLPRIKHFPFTYQGKKYASDATGHVALPSPVQGIDNTIYPFAGSFPLGGGAFARFQKFYAVTGAKKTAAFATFRPVSFTFSDLKSAAVSRTSLGEVAVKSSTGFETLLPEGSSTVVLQDTRVVPDNSGLSIKDLYYSVQRVEVEGNNVVNRSQTKFFPAQKSTVGVPLLFFDARVKARDALFGFGVGGKLVLAYPNGHSVDKKIGTGGLVQLPHLPRGQYHMSVVGPGLKIVQPVAMSRPQDVDLKVFTWLDVAAVAAVALAVAIGLVLFGRRFQRRRSARAAASAVLPEPLATTVPEVPESPEVPAVMEVTEVTELNEVVAEPAAEPVVVQLESEPLLPVDLAPVDLSPVDLSPVDLAPVGLVPVDLVPQAQGEPLPEPYPVGEPLLLPPRQQEHVIDLREPVPPDASDGVPPAQGPAPQTQVYGPFVLQDTEVRR